MSYKKGNKLIRKNIFFVLASHLTFYTIETIGWIVFVCLYRAKIFGRYRIKQFIAQSKQKNSKYKNAIIVSNHTTFLDPLLTSAAIIPCCMYHTLLEATVCTPVLGTLIQLLGGMPIPLGKDSFTRFIKGIQVGFSKRPFIHIYPEGECFIYNQNVQRFHTGAFRASKELNVPIIPMATVFKEPISIFGWKSRRPRIELVILPFIYPDKFSTEKEFADYTRSVIQNEIKTRNGTQQFFKGKMSRIEGINDVT